MEVALEAGADDVAHRRRRRDRGALEPADFEAVKAALEAAGLKPEVAEVTMRPENTVALERRGRGSGCRSCSTCIEDLDDVQAVYHNAEMAA